MIGENGNLRDRWIFRSICGGACCFALLLYSSGCVGVREKAREKWRERKKEEREGERERRERERKRERERERERPLGLVLLRGRSASSWVGTLESLLPALPPLPPFAAPSWNQVASVASSFPSVAFASLVCFAAFSCALLEPCCSGGILVLRLSYSMA